MSTYIINYDLVKPGQNYDRLIEAIKSYQQVRHPLESCWIIVSSQTPESIINYLKQFTDINDKILVAKVGAPAAWIGMYETTTAWLQANLN